MGLQGVIRAIYPPQCITCNALVDTDFGLCPDCWRDTPFISGCVCTKCGSPVPGDTQDADVVCDDCLQIARPWDNGRAALLYRDNARRIILALKHGDRMELARSATPWLLRAAQPLILPGTLVIPVPLHWWRLIRRSYNQSALLSAALARAAGLPHCPDALLRRRSTGSQEGKNRDERFANLVGAFALNPRRQGLVAGKRVLLIDDVMTSGATFAAAAEVCLAGGATGVSVLSLARVAKDA
jgi:ComF family protein